MAFPTEDPDIPESDWFDPFPEPHTIPSGWDLSELLSDPLPAPVLDMSLGTDVQSH
jgi:hypothetical protein